MTYGPAEYSASTRGLRALAAIADDLDLDRESAHAVAASVEAVERLQALRKTLLERGAAAVPLGLAGLTMPALLLIDDPMQLHKLLTELDELIRREHEALFAREEDMDRARRDMQMLYQLWLMATGRVRNHATLVDMRTTLEGVMATRAVCDEAALSVARTDRSMSG